MKTVSFESYNLPAEEYSRDKVRMSRSYLPGVRGAGRRGQHEYRSFPNALHLATVLDTASSEGLGLTTRVLYLRSMTSSPFSPANSAQHPGFRPTSRGDQGAEQTFSTSSRKSQGDPVGLEVSGLVVHVTSSMIPSLPLGEHRRMTPALEPVYSTIFTLRT